MRETNDTRALIDIARQTALSVEYELLESSTDHARAFVAGYEAGVESVHRDGVRDYSGALAVANKRIAELDSENIDLINMRAKKDARIADLEAQLAARPQAVGVVVTDKMAILYLKERQLSVYPEAIASVKDGITAALRTAHTVPLESTDVKWRASRDNKMVTSIGFADCDIPLYRGLAEPAQSGDAGVK